MRRILQNVHYVNQRMFQKSSKRSAWVVRRRRELAHSTTRSTLLVSETKGPAESGSSATHLGGSGAHCDVAADWKKASLLSFCDRQTCYKKGAQDTKCRVGMREDKVDAVINCVRFQIWRGRTIAADRREKAADVRCGECGYESREGRKEGAGQREIRRQDVMFTAQIRLDDEAFTTTEHNGAARKMIEPLPVLQSCRVTHIQIHSTFTW